MYSKAVDWSTAKIVETCCLQLHFPRIVNTVFFKEETTSFPFFLPLNNVVLLPKLPVRNGKRTNLSWAGGGGGADFFGL